MSVQSSPQRTWDRVGATLAWLAILACVAFTVWRVVAMTDKRAEERRQQDDDLFAEKSVPAHLLNPQLRTQARANVGMARLIPEQKSLIEPQLREVAKTPAERVWIVPPLVALAGVEAGRRHLEAVEEELRKATESRPVVTTQADPASVPASTESAATQSVTTQAATSQTSLPSSALSRDIAALRQV